MVSYIVGEDIQHTVPLLICDKIHPLNKNKKIKEVRNEKGNLL